MRGPFLGLDAFPAAILRTGLALLVTAENVRMTPQHLVGDSPGDIIEVKIACLPGHLGVKHDLQQQIAQLVA